MSRLPWRFRALCAVAIATTTPHIAQGQGATPRAGARPSEKPLPLEAGRTFSLDTREGTWLSLDVSPDGTTLVFDMLGDLYSLPFTGGDATRLTSGMAYDAQPRFSPDGKQVVFISDRDGADNVHVIDLSTKAVKAITRGKSSVYLSPDWSPDGQYIVASKGSFRGSLPKLWMYHADGGNGVALYTDPPNPAPGSAVQQAGAAFSADGKTIWYTQRTGAWNYNAQFPQYQVWIYDRETGEREAQSSRYGSAVRPTLSPDGRYMAYGSTYSRSSEMKASIFPSGDGTPSRICRTVNCVLSAIG